MDEHALLPLATGEVAPGALLLLQFLLLGFRIPVEGGRGAEEVGGGGWEGCRGGWWWRV